mgnify:CR=1 FL=1|tara:strand:- start:2570 stop:3652 length:1083 start_codon:yes stop_codon:yes gene_type:complete
MKTNPLEQARVFENAIKSPEWFVDNKTDFTAILEGFLYSGECMMFYGASGSGKSLFTYGLCCAIANNEKTFLGINKSSNQKVLYVDGEMSTNSIAQRVEMFDQLEGIDYMACSLIADSGLTVNFSESKQANWLVEKVKESEYNLVVIDSVRVCFNLTDENSSEGWKPVNDLVMRLRSSGSSVIVIHHSTKEAFKSGEVIWSGSSNAVTVFDRTCGIESLGNNCWGLVTGHKQGRSGDGWSESIESLSLTIDQDSNGFVKVDYQDTQLKLIDDYVDWLRYNNTDNCKNKLRKLSNLLDLKLAKSINQSIAWERTSDLWMAWSEFTNTGIIINTLDDFKGLLKPDFSFPDNDDDWGDFHECS